MHHRGLGFDSAIHMADEAGRARRGSAGGRPRGFDAEAYKSRHVVEGNKLKQWRGIATRYDMTARSYLDATLIRTR